MKKLLALLTLMLSLLSLPLTAGAERSGWKSSAFPFKKLKVVYLKTLVRQDDAYRKANPQYVQDDDAVRKTYLTLVRDLKNKGVTVYNNPVMLEDKKLRHTITLEVGVNQVGLVAPAPEQAAETAKKKKNAPQGTACASLTMVATKNGETIYQLQDDRTSDKYSSDALLASIIRDAAKDLTKNAKK